MSLLEDYVSQEKERQEVAKKNNEHYLSVDLPGTRNMSADISSARQRIEEMKKLRSE